MIIIGSTLHWLCISHIYSITWFHRCSTIFQRRASRRAYLKGKEPKVVEDEKSALFLRAAKTSERSLFAAAAVA